MTNPLDIMKNELFLQDPDYNEINGIMETEKVRFHEWLNGVMFSEKEVKTYQAFPVKVAPVIEDDIKLSFGSRCTFWVWRLYIVKGSVYLWVLVILEI